MQPEMEIGIPVSISAEDGFPRKGKKGKGQAGGKGKGGAIGGQQGGQQQTRGTCIHVRNLPESVNSEQLKGLFLTCGQVLKADVKTTPDGKSRCIGYVILATEAEALKAVAEKHDQDCEGRKLHVSMAESKNDGKAKGAEKGPVKGKGKGKDGKGKGPGPLQMPNMLSDALPPHSPQHAGSGGGCGSPMAQQLAAAGYSSHPFGLPVMGGMGYPHMPINPYMFPVPPYVYTGYPGMPVPGMPSMSAGMPPPAYLPPSASPFGTAAHAEAAQLLNQGPGAGPGGAGPMPPEVSVAACGEPPMPMAPGKGEKAAKGRGKAKKGKEGASTASTPPTGKVFTGALKSLSTKNGYGFIDCKESHETYHRDVYVECGMVPEGTKLGTVLAFNIMLSAKGHPQAANVKPVGPHQV